MTFNRKLMDLARTLSLQSTFRVRIGAVAVKGKSVVGLGHNRHKTHPLISKDCHRKLHAEVACIIGVDRRSLNGATLYVYRENLMGKGAISKPCPWCEAILREVGIREVFYTDPKEQNGIGRMIL